MVTLEKGNLKITLKNDIQVAAYKKSGWTEVKETPKKKENGKDDK